MRAKRFSGWWLVLLVPFSAAAQEPVVWRSEGPRAAQKERVRQARLRVEISELEKQNSGIKTRVRRQANMLYRLMHSGWLPIAGGLDALLGHASRVNRLKRMLEKDLGTVKALEKRVAGLRVEQAALVARFGALAPSDEQPSLNASWQPDTYAEEPIAAPSGTPLTHGTFRLSEESSEESGFASLRGALAMPVDQPSEIRDARKREGDGLGLSFVVTQGAVARAVASGRVAFSERYGSYGKLVILEHGESYYTVYAGLGNVFVQVGDELSQNARIGEVSRETSPPELFFEIRRGKQTLAPRPWLGL